MERKEKKRKKKSSKKEKIPNKPDDPFDEDIPWRVPVLSVEEIEKLIDNAPSLEYLEKHPGEAERYETRAIEQLLKDKEAAVKNTTDTISSV